MTSNYGKNLHISLCGLKKSVWFLHFRARVNSTDDSSKN